MKKTSDKKFIEIFNVLEWEVETEDGWKDIKASGKTIPYKIWEINLENGLFLKGADNHIIINNLNQEIYIKDLKKGDILKTQKGDSRILLAEKTNEKVNMYDIEIDSENHTYYTNGILSHNSLWLSNLAARSISLGYNTAYVTLELQEELVHMRIGSNLLELPIDNYDKIAEDTDFLKKKIKNLKNSSFTPLGKLHVKEFPSSTASVNDIKSYLKKVQEILGYKFDNVFVDYINIMKNWRNPNTENTYMKIKQISEDLRAMAMEEQWTVITVTQTNRSGWETSDLSITNIAESAALLHTVDMLFGIVADPIMKANGEYHLKCLANRVAGYENTRKRFTVDWKYARIEEDKEAQIEDMDFIFNSVIGGQKQKRGQRKTGGQSSIIAMIGSNIDPDKLENNKDMIQGSQEFIKGEGLF